MKKLILFALLGMLVLGGMTRLYAQEDSAKVAEEPKDTISIDNMDPVFYDDDTAPQKSNTMTYAIIGGIIVIGGVGFYFIRKKKKQA